MTPGAATTFRFALAGLPAGPGPGFRRLAEALKEELLAARPVPGARLPTVRELAGRLSLHPTTARAAYNLLETEGWIASHVGRGTFVGRIPEGGFPFRFPAAVEQALALAGSHIDLEGIPAECVDFLSLAPEVGPEALVELQAAFHSALAEEGEALLGYGHPAGLPALRAAVAERLSRTGRPVRPEEVIVTNGAQQALELVVRCFLSPGEALVATCPTYLNLMGVLQAQGVRLLPVPAGPAGVDTSALARAAAEPGARLLYVMPSFHNPTGATLDLEARREVLAVSRRAGLPVLEDDLEGPQRYDGQIQPSLHALDGEGRVLLVGSVSKALFPGLRVGWIVAPPGPFARLLALKRFTDLETSALPQAVLARLLGSAWLEDHLARTRRTLRRRRDLLIAALGRLLPPGSTWTVPDGGSTLWLQLPEPVDGRELAAAARRRGVLVAPGDLFFPDRRRTGAVRLSFARVPEDRILDGVRVLAELAGERLESSPRPGRRAQVL